MEYQFIDSNRLYIFSIAEPDDNYHSNNTLNTDADDNRDTKGSGNNKPTKQLISNTSKYDKDLILPRIDNDGAWKYALEVMFFEFLELFVPDLYGLIDTGFKPESMETELKGLLPDSKPKKRMVDKLVSVKYKTGKNALLLIHIEPPMSH